MSNYTLTLSTTEPNNLVGLLKFRQGDKNSQVLNVTVTENGKLFKFDGLAVFFNSVLPNGAVVRDKVQTIDYANSKLTYKVIDSFLQEVATISAWFSFENGTKVVDSTKNFRYLVAAGWQSCITQGNYIYELSEIQREIEEIIGNKDFTSLISKISSLKTRIDDLEKETTAQLAQTKSETEAKLATKSTKEEVAIERNRINNLMVLPEGSTTNDARLEDIRIGTDGKVYASPSEAVRSQFTSVGEHIKRGTLEYAYTIKDLFDDSFRLRNTSLSSDGGMNETDKAYMLVDKWVYALKGSKIGVKHGYEFQVCEYNDVVTSSFRKYSGVLKSTDTYETSADGYIRVAVSNEDSALTAVDSIIDNIILNVITGYKSNKNTTDISAIQKSLDELNLYRLHSTEGIEFDFYELNSSGAIVQSTSRVATTKFLFVQKGSKISTTSNDYTFNVCTYSDENFENVIYFYSLMGESETVVIPQDCYIRFSIGHSDDRNVVDLNIVENFEVSLIVSNTKKEISKLKNKVDNAADSTGDKPFYFSENIPTEYYTPVSQKPFDLFSYEPETTSYQDFITDFNQLVVDSGLYGKVTTLGKDATNVYDVYRYRLSQPEYDTSYTTKRNPVITIACGLHGFEKASMFSLYNFVRELVEEWKNSPVLEYLRHNCTFEIIPVANPYGFQNNTYANGRLDGEHVNLNRNFSFYWSSTGEGSQYGGPSPFSEAETKYIKEMIDENKNQFLYIDFHTTGNNKDVDDIGFYNWISDDGDLFYNEKLILANKKHIENITRNITYRYELDIPQNEFIGRMTHETGPGLSQSYAASVGLKCVTFEVAPKFLGQEAYNNNIIKANTEMFVNYLMTVIRTL